MGGGPRAVRMQKIIIAEDLRELFEKQESFLKQAGVKLFSAGSNEEVLGIHRTEKADLIIANLDSQGMSGEMLCSVIRQSVELCRASLIIMHGGAPSDMSRISACRANAFIERSADPATLLAKARQLMTVPVRGIYRAPVGIRAEHGGRRQPSLGYSENISVTGMLVDSEKKLRTGDVIWCWFVLPDSTHVRTNAEIVRTAVMATEHDANQYGIRFLQLGIELKTAIGAYIATRRARL
jgi:response regulator RpfG family c-di-GMP phosphodiesterase